MYGVFGVILNICGSLVLIFFFIVLYVVINFFGVL